MMQPATGLVLPADVLTSSWFILLLTVVAFNTIIYVGLTLAKLVPMPRQIHPSRVRLWVRALGVDPDKELPVKHRRERDTLTDADPYDDMRQRIVCRDIPLAFGITGILVIGVAATALIAFGSYGLNLHLLEMSTGVLLLILAQLFALRAFRPVTVTWSWAVASVLIVVLSVVRAAYLDSPYPLTYAYIAMTAFAPVALYWRPSIVAGLVMLLALVALTQLHQGGDDMRLIIAGVTALLVGAMLLRLRLKSVAELSQEKSLSEQLVTTDVLTGALTARGLLTVVPAIAGMAERTGEQVLLIDIRIPELAEANTKYGARYGDDVLRAAAKTIDRVVRTGDLVARWQGAEFVIAGIGSRPNADELVQRVQNALHDTGINLGKRPLRLSVGTAAGDPRETTFDQLLTEARYRRELTEVAGPTAS